MIEVIPAIDLSDGRCVRLQQGSFDDMVVYSDDPLAVAEQWQAEGAQRLHVVDLDGARAGEPQNVLMVTEIVASVSIPVQLGGGIRDMKTIDRALSTGVHRVVISTMAALDSDLAGEIFEIYGESVVVGIDARDGLVAVRGWQEITKKSAAEFAREMEELGAPRIIYTDIARDGMLQGPNLHSLRKVAEGVQIPVIASGGFSRLQDLENLVPLQSIGVEGVIIGKALYAGQLRLRDAIGIGMADVSELEPGQQSLEL